MITLNGRQTIGSFDVYRDDANPLVHYTMRHAPKIAVDENGRPNLSMVWYRRDVSELTEEERRTRLGGGILTLSTDLAASDEELDEIRQTLAQQKRSPKLLARFGNDVDRLAQALKITTVPITSGMVGIAILGEDQESAGEFVSSLVGVGKVSMVGPQRASFMAKLTQDGAVLLWEMLERNLAAIRVEYILQFAHRLNAVRMVVWCNARKSYDALQEQWQELHDAASFSDITKGNMRTLKFSHDQGIDAGELVEITSGNSQTSGVIVTPETTIDQQQLLDLERSGHQMIQEFLAATFLQWNPGEGFHPEEQPTLETELATYQDGQKYGRHDISYYKLREWSEEMSADLHHTFTSKAVLEGELAPNDNLSNILRGHDASEFRTQIELDADWYKYLDVQVLCTADFGEDPVDLVKAHLSYDETGPSGRVHEVKDFVFRQDTAPQHFLTFLADPNKKSYDFEYEVFYRGGAQTLTVRGRTDETILVLDTDRLGILHVDVELGLIDWEQVKAVFVEMWYGSGADRKETQFTLSEEDPARRWTEVVAREVDEAYGYQVTFIDANNQRIASEPSSSRSKRLIIDQPLGDSLEVAIVPAGSFGEGGLARIVVATRYRDDANDYSNDESFILSSDDQSELWKVPLVDKNLRQYEYQVTVFYSDGVTREEDWANTDKPVLAVGDPYGFRVQISPYLLKNPPYAFGTIHLTFEDAEAAIRSEKTIELTDFTQPLFWRFRLGAPDRHTYKYQLTLFTAEGEEVRIPEAEDSREILVLRPPSPVPSGGGD